MGKEIAQQYFSLKQAACYLGLSPKTIYVWAEGNKIPAYKVGRVWRFDRAELDSFVHQGSACYNFDQSRSAAGFGQKGGITCL
jgi:excisionase family DNA binding protein